MGKLTELSIWIPDDPNRWLSPYLLYWKRGKGEGLEPEHKAPKLFEGVFEQPKDRNIKK